MKYPPGAHNWCIGCAGTAVTKPGIPMGIIDSQNVQVTPSSLYLEQLRERLGDQALSNIGYGSTDQGIGNPGSASAVTVTGNRR